MINFEETINEMKLHGMQTPCEKNRFSVPNAKVVLTDAMTYFLSRNGDVLVWSKEYDDVADWLSDNKGRGLFMYGDCGRGKTLLSKTCIPAILLKYCKLICHAYDVQDVNDNPELLRFAIISIDDIGTEDVSNKFGNKRMIVVEALDMAEKYGKIIILTSNLDREKLIEKYGERAFDRILSTTKRVKFTGKSLRK
jgi:DNA replication protein DnaC